MAGRHEHAGQHDERLGPTLHTAIDRLLNDGPGKFKKASLDDLLRITAAKHLHQRAELRRALLVPAAVADQQDRGFHDPSVSPLALT